MGASQSLLSYLRHPSRAYGAGKRWAVHRSASLRGLLYLPVPPDPIPAALARSAPTVLRALDEAALARGACYLPRAGEVAASDLSWADLDPVDAALLHRGEEVLALARLAARANPETAAAHLAVADRLVAGWCEAHPLASRPGWDLDALARRVACWSQALVEAGSRLQGDVRRRWLQSVYLQARFLTSHRSAEPASPARLAASRALLGASAVLGGHEPRAWGRLAERGLAAAAARFGADGAVADGGVVEHLGALSDLIDSVALLPPESGAGGRLRRRLQDAARFAVAMAHADGTPAGLGLETTAAPALGRLLEVVGEGAARRAGLAVFPEAGFAAWNDLRRGDSLLIDWRGRDSGPGAAGNYELSFAGRHLVVTPRLAVGDDPMRRHNSVRIDGQCHRAGDRRLDRAVWGDGPRMAYLGLGWAASGVHHQRRFLILDGNAVVVIDRVEGAIRGVESLLHLAAGVRVVAGGERRLFLENGEQTATLSWIPGLAAAADQAEVATWNGASARANVLRLWAPGGGPRLLAYLLCRGRRRSAELELYSRAESRIAARFDPRRYVVRWEADHPPRIEFAD